MAEKKVKMALPSGQIVDGVEVPVEETVERWSDIKLQDGTSLRIKMTVVSAVRADNDYDPLGQPFYSINMTPVIAVAEIPEHLKKQRSSN
jgi:hypothetical protein